MLKLDFPSLTMHLCHTYYGCMKQKGFGLVTIIIIIVLMIAGYIVISRIIDSDSAQEIIEKANKLKD